MASYQDLETRMITCEEKLDFILKTFTVTKQYRSIVAPDQVIRESKTLLDVYREMKTLGAQIVAVNPAETQTQTQEQADAST